MSDTVSNIQTRVRWESRDSQFSLTDTTGLIVTNTIYRRICALIEWPELARENTSLSTTANQESITWPSVAFIDVKSIEVQDPNDNLKYRQVPPAKTELDWSLARQKESSFPQVYKRGHDGTQNIIMFAPAPNTSSLTVRIIGQVEPSEVTAAASTTIFVSEGPDDALAYLISADIADKRNQPNRARMLVSKAAETLSSVAGKEITPAELKSDVGSG